MRLVAAVAELDSLGTTARHRWSTADHYQEFARKDASESIQSPRAVAALSTHSCAGRFVVVVEHTLGGQIATRLSPNSGTLAVGGRAGQRASSTRWGLSHIGALRSRCGRVPNHALELTALAPSVHASHHVKAYFSSAKRGCQGCSSA